MLLPSPIQPLHVVLKLMKDTDCTTILAPRKGRHLVASQAAKITGATLIGVPSIEALLSAEKKPFPYSKGLQNAYTEPLVIMHTSGSTGLPKPIVWTEGWAASFCHQITVPPPPGFQSHEALWQGKQILLLMPAFHVSCLHSRMADRLALAYTVLWLASVWQPVYSFALVNNIRLGGRIAAADGEDRVADGQGSAV